ncbi:MAG: hypothetical protein H0T56_06175 [Pseudaminobacter sp.]|nr:hypothetical protein [Pseudaminobacter sp.]
MAAERDLWLTKRENCSGDFGMNRKRLFALLAFLCLAGFFGVVLAFVPRLDLAAAILIGLALAAYDLWTQLRPRRRPG